MEIPIAKAGQAGSRQNYRGRASGAASEEH
jgi:hypothetical protein